MAEYENEKYIRRYFENYIKSCNKQRWYGLDLSVVYHPNNDCYIYQRGFAEPLTWNTFDIIASKINALGFNCRRDTSTRIIMRAEDFDTMYTLLKLQGGY